MTKRDKAARSYEGRALDSSRSGGVPLPDDVSAEPARTGSKSPRPRFWGSSRASGSQRVAGFAAAVILLAGWAPLHATNEAAKQRTESDVRSAATERSHILYSALTRAESSLDEGYRRWRHSIGFHVSPFYWGWTGYGWPHVEVWSHPYYGETWGPVDLNIKPKKAEVFVDGDYVGRVDQFDGFPRYLWLERGSRHLVIYKEGYESLALKIRVRPGQVLDLREELVPGEAKTPEELFAQLDTEREPAPSRKSRSERPVRRAAREPVERTEESWRSSAPPPRTTVEEDQRQAPGRLVISVEPADAVVYLDGRLVGSGQELARLHHGLMVDAGEHTVEVTRPGHRPQSRQLRVAAGEELVIDLRLEADSSR